MAVLVHIKSVTSVTHKICDTFPPMMHYATYHSRFLNETELVIHVFQFFAGMAIIKNYYVFSCVFMPRGIRMLSIRATLVMEMEKSPRCWL